MPGPDPVGITGKPFDHARNTACQLALENGFEWLFFLDSDVLAPPDAILRLRNHRLPIVSGMYCRRSPPHAVPVMIKNGNWFTSFTPGEVVEVDLVGAGCLLIHRTVLEKFHPIDPARNKRWFDWRVDMAGLVPPGEALSEDFSFNHFARKQGWKILVDTGVRCKHVGLAEADLGTFLPLVA